MEYTPILATLSGLTASRYDLKLGRGTKFYLWLSLNKDLGYTHGQLIFPVYFFLAGLFVGEQPFNALHKSFVLPHLVIPPHADTSITKTKIDPAK